MGCSVAGEAIDLWDEALGWLENNYPNFSFFAERDVVGTLQCFLLRAVAERGLPWRVFNDYPMLPGNRRSVSTDLVIAGQTDVAELAVEMKYEPSHDRKDILRGKVPVVSWGPQGVAGDIRRIHEFVLAGKARTACSVLIDEGGYFRNRPVPSGALWRRWGTGPWVLIGRMP